MEHDLDDACGEEATAVDPPTASGVAGVVVFDDRVCDSDRRVRSEGGEDQHRAPTTALAEAPITAVWAASAAGIAIAGDVILESAILNDQRARGKIVVAIVDCTAGTTMTAIAGVTAIRPAAAIPAQAAFASTIATEGAVADDQRAAVRTYRPTPAARPAIPAQTAVSTVTAVAGRVVVETAAFDGQGAVQAVDAAPPAATGAATAPAIGAEIAAPPAIAAAIVADAATADGQGAPLVVDAASPLAPIASAARRAIRAIGAVAVGDHDAGEFDSGAFVDVQDAIQLVAVHDRDAGPGTDDGDAALDVQIARGVVVLVGTGPRQRVGSGGEVDSIGTVPAHAAAESTVRVGGLDRFAQRAAGARGTVLIGFCGHVDGVGVGHR